MFEVDGNELLQMTLTALNSCRLTCFRYFFDILLLICDRINRHARWHRHDLKEFNIMPRDTDKFDDVILIELTDFEGYLDFRPTVNLFEDIHLNA